MNIEDKYKFILTASRQSPPLWADLKLRGFQKSVISELIGYDGVFIRKIDFQNLYVEEETNKRYEEWVAKKVEDISYFCNIAKDCKKCCDEFLEFCKENACVDFAKCNNEELEQFFQKYVATHIRTVVWRLHIWQLDEELENLIKKISPNFDTSIIETEIELPFAKMNNAIYEVAERYKKSEDIEEEVNNILRKYAWLGTSRLMGEALSYDDVMRQVKMSKDCKVKSLKEQRCEDLAELTPIIKEYVYLRSYRTDAVYEGDFLMRNMFNAIALNLGIKYDDLIYMTVNEIFVALRTNQLDKSIIAKRKEYYVAYLLEDGEICFFEGKENVSLKEKVEINKTEKIMGRMPFSARAVGNAKLVLCPEDIKKINACDIIVTPMATCDMIIKHLNCGGIITDEGGITCHAAQIAMEYNIPCIFGTKIATKVINDGDLVEIKENGEVEIIVE